MKEQKVICVQNPSAGYITQSDIDRSLSSYLNNGWLVTNTVAQHVSAGTNCAKYGSVIFVIEKTIQ